MEIPWPPEELPLPCNVWACGLGPAGAAAGGGGVQEPPARPRRPRARRLCPVSAPPEGWGRAGRWTSTESLGRVVFAGSFCLERLRPQSVQQTGKSQ